VRLLHLTAVGPEVPAATIIFAPRLTVVYGASEAGKSYVLEAVDFVLGASSRVRDIPEAEGYRQLLVGIDFGSGDVVTLARNIRGGNVLVYDDDVRSRPTETPERVLKPKHRKGDTETVSHYLLDRLGIADAKLRKNQRNELVSMSFRHIAHLAIVHEDSMLSRVSPVETGNYSARTTERSAFKLLLEGEDDSELVAGEDPQRFRRANRAQLQVLERAILQARVQLEGSPEPSQLADQLSRLISSIEESTSGVSAISTERDRAIVARERLQTEQRLEIGRLREATILLGRLSMLDAQYEADLGRLQMVKDAGTFLGYFDTETCIFCGAAAEHQQREHAVYETVQLAEAVDAEAGRTQALRGDLQSTLEALSEAAETARARSVALGDEIEAQNARLIEVEERLLPQQRDLASLVAKRSEIEGLLALWHRIDDLASLHRSVEQEKPTESDQVADGVSASTAQEFSSTLRRVLTEWSVPGAETSEFRFENPPDVVVQRRSRSDRGKGMRSVLHAGFAVSLVEHCMERDLPHPGFVALDTPVLTYRDADAGDPTVDDQIPRDQNGPDSVRGEDELVSGAVAQAFYDYLALKCPGQVVVLENQTPPRIEAAGCDVVYFTGNAAVGRAGFYPPLQ